MGGRRIRSHCSSCGSSDVSFDDVIGQSFPYKDFPSVLITLSGTSLAQCRSCSEVFLSRKHGDSEALDKVIRTSLRSQVVGFVKRIKEDTGLNQIELCARLGISTSHLSRIKSGAEVPSFRTYNFLKVLAALPAAARVSDPENSQDIPRAAIG